MFSKRPPNPDTKNLAALDGRQPAALPSVGGNTAKSKPRVASLLSENLTIEGNLLSDGEIQIDGVVRGDIRVGKLTLGETGHIEGQIFAESVEIRGRMIGSITAKQVKLLGTAHVEGDITHEQLAMETGAFFQGRSLKFQRPPAVPTPSNAMTETLPLTPKV
ncbi:MAG: cell shape determination protein CcmA [Phenylobacterium zucineum]|nr:MAG: cell shape determination protein CcmA [Phenylobacterium zucineum]